GDLWDKLKAVMEFVRDEVKSISLPDPGNSSNDIADTLTDSDKDTLSYDMKRMIERIEEDSDTIKSYYPINEKFPPEDDEEKSNNSYGVKTGIGLSVPPVTRFG